MITETINKRRLRLSVGLQSNLIQLYGLNWVIMRSSFPLNVGIFHRPDKYFESSNKLFVFYNIYLDENSYLASYRVSSRSIHKFSCQNIFQDRCKLKSLGSTLFLTNIIIFLLNRKFKKTRIYMIPPAFAKIWQLMFQRIFK